MIFKDNTCPSDSSNTESRWPRIRPTTTSWTSFHINSEPDSWQSVIPIRRWIPWWRIKRPEHGTSSEWSTVAAAYLSNYERSNDYFRMKKKKD